MDENTGNNKVLGLEKAAYVKVSYVLVLVSAGLGLLISLLTGIGLGTPAGSGLINLIGLIGWIMALLGWLAFQKEFTVIELSHLRFIAVLFIALIVLGIIIGSILGGSGLLWGVFSFLLSAASVGFLYLGFRLWGERSEVTQETLKSEFETVKSRFSNNRSDF